MRKVFTLHELKKMIAEIESTIGDSTEPVFLCTDKDNGIGLRLVKNILSDGNHLYDLEVIA